MGKRIFWWGLVSGLCAALAGIVWDKVYYFAMMTSFSSIINPLSITGASLFGTFLATAGFAALHKWLPKYRDGIFNLTLSVVTIASLVSPLSFSLPLDVEFPEMFPALAMPMHFFPAMALFTLRPFFIKE